MVAGMEFYCYERELWCKHSDGRNEIVDESKSELIQPILEKVRECYPEAYDALAKHYEKSQPNPRYYQFLMARRFLMCNFSSLDATSFDVEDIGMDGKFNFEKVACPIRCECPLADIVCGPKFNSSLTDAELRVCKLWYEGRTKEDIAEELFISQETVNNHIRNAYSKLGFHDKSEFVKYAKDNNMFK